MARNLSRNTRLFIKLAETAIGSVDDTDCWELKILDGYSFSQDVASQDVSVSESASECSGVAGLARGTQSFNTALNPVEVSFSTYARPVDDGTNAGAVEQPLWQGALASAADFASAVEAFPAGLVINANYSDVNELQLFTLYFVLGSTTYVIDNFTVGTAESDFSIDGIATINWSGSGTAVAESITAHNIIAAWTGGTDYKAVYPISNNGFLRNKLSTLTLVDNNAATIDKTAPDETEDLTAASSGGVLTSSAWSLTPDDYIGGRAYNVNRGQWANIFDNAAGTVTVSASEATRIDSDWESGDTVKLYLSTAEIDDISSINTTTGVVTLTGTLGGVADRFNDGRMFNATDGAWATILSHTVDTTSDVTPIPADIALTAGWGAGDEIVLYTSAEHAAVSYCIPITAGTLTLENNMSYLTPEELAIVNQPLAGFTGNRSVSGSVTAYLNTGAQGSAGLLADLLGKITEVSNDYELILSMGNDLATTPRVEYQIRHAQISVPTINVEDVLSTEITFTAQAWDDTNNVANFEGANDMIIKYVATMN